MTTPTFGQVYLCPQCKGRGMKGGKPCLSCDGAGTRKADPPKRLGHPTNLTIPKPTSKAAADSLDPAHLIDDCWLVLAHLSLTGGDIDEATLRATGLHPNALRARRGRLVDVGYVKDSGRTRATRTGRQAIIWEPTPSGEAALKDHGQ